LLSISMVEWLEIDKANSNSAKTFFAGGHDTTAALITVSFSSPSLRYIWTSLMLEKYHFYLLSTHPDILARVREEQNTIFGTDFDKTVSRLTADPSLLNQIPLTHAVLKECLRLHPVGFTIREAVPGATVTFEGREYPMDNHMIAILGLAMHRDPAIWTNPSDFDPDRWLSPDKHSNGAWQAFEKGPRNCIGQQLAMLEVKAISVLVTRWFDFEPVFKDHGLSIPGYGGRAYQELKLIAKPKDGIPMRAKMVKV